MNRYFSLAARRLVVIAVLASTVFGATMFGFVPLAEAHTDFEFSTPADGELVDQPVSEIRLRFTAASIVAGDGFVVLTPSGQLVQPEVRVSEDAREFTLVFDPALTDGVVGVQWSVRAGDAHPIEGAFSFTTTAVAPAPDPVPIQPDSVDATSEQSESSQGTEVAAAADTTSSRIEASEQAAAAAVVSLEDFLSAGTSSGAAGSLGYLGRLASQAGSLVAIGVVGFALLVSQNVRETKLFVHLIRQAGVLTVVGALVEAMSLVMQLGGVTDALVGTAGVAIGLRVVGAAALVAHTNSILLVGERRPAAVASERALATVGGGSFSGAIAASENKPVAPMSSALGTRGVRDRIEPLAWLFAGLIAVSYAFDGHTVTKGNRLLTSLVDVIHVAGGAIWLGGLICVVLLSRRRGSNSQGSDFVTTVLRFSVVAAVALVAVGAAGLVLTVTILDSVSELWATAWGRILVAKVLIVAVAVAAGAFNHFVLIPEMQSISAHDDARQSLVRTMVIELIAIGVAVALTAFLVAAAS